MTFEISEVPDELLTSLQARHRMRCRLDRLEDQFRLELHVELARENRPIGDLARLGVIVLENLRVVQRVDVLQVGLEQKQQHGRSGRAETLVKFVDGDVGHFEDFLLELLHVDAFVVVDVRAVLFEKIAALLQLRRATHAHSQIDLLDDEQWLVLHLVGKVREIIRDEELLVQGEVGAAGVVVDHLQ